MPLPRSSSLKRGRDEEDEEDPKYTKMERKYGRSSAEKVLVAAKTQSDPASPARNEEPFFSEESLLEATV